MTAAVQSMDMQARESTRRSQANASFLDFPKFARTAHSFQRCGEAFVISESMSELGKAASALAGLELFSLLVPTPAHWLAVHWQLLPGSRTPWPQGLPAFERE